LILVVSALDLDKQSYTVQDFIPPYKYDGLSLEHQFKLFIESYNRTYKSKQEEKVRFAIFADNIIKAEKMTAESKGKTKYGVTQFSDMTPQEFSHLYLMPKGLITKEKMPKNKEFIFNGTKSELETGKQFFDWRFPDSKDGWGVNCLTGIYNQGSCGSCWSFSATEQIESMNCIQGHTGGHAISYSMQQIVDCDHNQVDGCGGGSTWSAYDYIISQGGIDLYSAYPYTGVQGACRFNPNAVGARISSWGYITTEDNEALMKTYLFSDGPMSICVDASQWMSYHGGIVTACLTQIDHCVQITGYWIIDNIATWAVRNEWGTGWGVDGYIYLEYGHNICALGECVTTVATS